jgi:hypothetical protein
MLCKSFCVRFCADSIPAALTISFQQVAANQARTEAFVSGIEKACFSTHGT